MVKHAHIQTLEPELAKQIADGIHLGCKFVFLDFDRIPDDSLKAFEWKLGSNKIASQKDRPTGRMTVSLTSDHPLCVPGMEIHFDHPPNLRLQSITSDRALYRKSCDVVELLVLDLIQNSPPNQSGQTKLIDVFCDSDRIDQYSVQLDRNGVGSLRLFDLPIGNYEVNWADESEARPCKFRVAGFQLAPLTAALSRVNLTGQQLSVMLRLDRYGKRFDGPAKVDLYNGEQRIDSRHVTARNGTADATLELSGDGPHHLDVRLSQHSDATATIPILGSRISHRSPTILSAAGPVYEASMMPTSGANETRGLFVQSNRLESSPVRIHGIDSTHAILEAMTDLEEVCAVAERFGNGSDDSHHSAARVNRWPKLKAGESVSVELSEVAGLLSVACFVGSDPWESTSFTIQPTKITASISVANDDETDKPISPGSRVAINVETGTDDGVVQIIVKDSRLKADDRPLQRLAEQIKQTAQRSEPGIPCIASGKIALRQWTVSKANAEIGFDIDGPVHEQMLPLLVNHGILTQEQADDAREAVAITGLSFDQYLCHSGYTDPKTICDFIAAHYDIPRYDLSTRQIAYSCLELCPESVARENGIMPAEVRDGTFFMAAANPFDAELHEKIQFILNRNIRFGISSRDNIYDAINNYYGQIETESVDSMLQEFLDTAIDFTETESEGTNPQGSGVPFNLTSLGTLTTKGSATQTSPKTPTTEVPAATIFCQLVPIQASVATTVVQLPESPGRYTIEVFAISDGHWCQSELQFHTKQNPYVRMELPDEIYKGDRAVGRVIARCASGKMSLRVCCGDRPVELLNTATGSKSTGERITIETTEAEYTFAAGEGEFFAEVRDESAHDASSSAAQTQTIAQHRHEVRRMGYVLRRRRTLRMLEPGESLRRGDAQQIRLLPGPEPIARMVAEATANYKHLCCEQTAAKLFASFAYCAQLGHTTGEHQRALQAIAAGLQRMQSLWSDDFGFAFYPGQNPNERWGCMAATHLLKVGFFADAMAPEFNSILQQVQRLADAAAEFYQIEWPPKNPQSGLDAYAITRFPKGDHDTSRELARKIVRTNVDGDPANWRNETAFATATLLRIGNQSDVSVAIGVANQILSDLNPEGRLYSTYDSVAAIVLLNELSQNRNDAATSHVTINGESVAVGEAIASSREIQSITSQEKTVAVELTEWSRDDWDRFDSSVTIGVTVSGPSDGGESIYCGDSVTMRIDITDGYQAGDLVWISLPPCLSRIQDGGQVKQFSIDPQGKSHVEIRLAATVASHHSAMDTNVDTENESDSMQSSATGYQHFCVYLRNMFFEDRVGNPGPIPIRVENQNSRPVH